MSHSQTLLGAAQAKKSGETLHNLDSFSRIRTYQREHHVLHPSFLENFGVCVIDLNQSVRFYTEGLGFELEEYGHHITDEIALVAELPPPVDCDSRWVRKGEVRPMLMGWRIPKPEGQATASRVHPGLTHMVVWLDDVDRVAARVEKVGGTILESTRSDITLDNGGGTVQVLFAADPNGLRTFMFRRRRNATFPRGSGGQPMLRSKFPSTEINELAIYGHSALCP